MSGEAGKGDDYRPVDKKKYDATLDRVFGERDILSFQKGNRYSVTVPRNGSDSGERCRK